MLSEVPRTAPSVNDSQRQSAEQVPSLLPKKPRILEDVEKENILRMFEYYLEFSGYVRKNDNLLVPGFDYAFEKKVGVETAKFPHTLALRETPTGFECIGLVITDQSIPALPGLVYVAYEKHGFHFMNPGIAISEREDVKEAVLRSLQALSIVQVAVNFAGIIQGKIQKERPQDDRDQSEKEYPRYQSQKLAKKELLEDRKIREVMQKHIRKVRSMCVFYAAATGIFISQSGLPEKAADIVAEKIAMIEEKNDVEELAFHTALDIRDTLENAKKSPGKKMVTGGVLGGMLGYGMARWRTRKKKAEEAIQQLKASPKEDRSEEQ